MTAPRADTEALLTELDGEHSPASGRDECVRCDTPWPCAAYRAYAALREREAELAAAEETKAWALGRATEAVGELKAALDRLAPFLALAREARAIEAAPNDTLDEYLDGLARAKALCERLASLAPTEGQADG